MTVDVDEWQELPRTAPWSPDWIGRRVAGRIEELRAQWRPEARRRFAELDSGGSLRSAGA